MAPRRRRPRANLLGTAVIVGLIGLSLVAAYPGGALVLAAVGGIGWALWHHFARRRGAAARTVLRERRLGYELADLDRLSGVEFEAWIAAVLEKADFEIQDLRAGGDFGVDVIAAYGGVRFGIQAKRYKKSVNYLQQSGFDWNRELGCEQSVALPCYRVI